MFKNIWAFTKKVAYSWKEDKVASLSASLAYYTIFSLTPLLIICIALAGLFLGEEAARGQIVDQISSLVGHETGKQLQSMIESANKPKTAIFAQAGGIIMLLVGATGMFGEIQSGLNTIWGIKNDPNKGWWDVIKQRFLSFTMILGLVFLLLVSLVLSAFLTLISNSLGGFVVLSVALSYGLSFVIVMVLFALMYKFLPETNIQWSDVWLGALVASILFAIGKFFLGLYLTHADATSTFGASGSLVVLLIWAYYVAQILFTGAEITEIIASNRKN
ncbi:MAG: YihY/virulence factor BrkB family protein [Legionella sp.]|nr:YihY/virulence factor BrkB family protein [Legionella sp.]